MRRRSLRLVAGLAVATALVSGCSSEHEANDTLPNASETSASPSLQPLGPADFPVPDEARTQDAAGADAALRYYLDLVTHQQAKDGEPLRDLSRNCNLCLSLADRADQDALSGYSVEGGKATITSLGEPEISGSHAEFSFSISQSAVMVRDEKGDPVPDRGSAEIPALTGAAALDWNASEQAWIVSFLSFERP